MTRGNLNDVLADESPGSSSFRMGRLSRGLVVLHVALSCGLLVAAGLMIKSVVNLGSADWGFEPEAVFTARLGLFPSDYPEVEDRRRFFEELHGRLEGRADVIAASLTPSLPVTGSNLQGNYNSVGNLQESRGNDSCSPAPGALRAPSAALHQARHEAVTFLDHLGGHVS